MRSQLRTRLVLALLLLAMLGLMYRLVQLSLIDRAFLMKQGNARILRHMVLPANRGMITDRHNKPLAISTPVISYWFDPHLFHPGAERQKQLADQLGVSTVFIDSRIKKSSGRGFFYLKRRLPPATLPAITALKIEGLYSMQEYQRYYPQASVMSHILGFTNIDDQGQEGLELAYNSWLTGVPGKQSVVRDRLGRVVNVIAIKKAPKQGKPLTLSVDERVQYIAYRALGKAVHDHDASSGSLVVLDVKTGEVIAMVNAPSFNPNNRKGVAMNSIRNRAVTDLFEPGSTIKPFTVALALMSKKYNETTTINTNPGRMKVGGFTIRDDGLNYGVINLKQLLQKSSNIGAAKVLMSLNAAHFWHLLQTVGLGQRTLSGFPGEADGIITGHDHWYPSEVAALAYGYGISVTALQLAHSYSVLATGGVSHPVTFIKRESEAPSSQILPPKIATTVLHMLESVVDVGGTGRRAAIRGYRVAGKTGTAYVASGKGYDKKRYISSFAGIAPVSNPRFVIAVVIREPKNKHFGAIVAAPTFKSVMQQTLHLYGIAPDKSFS